MRPRLLGILLGLALLLTPFMVVAHASKNARTSARAAKPAPVAEKEAASVPDPVPPPAQPSAAAPATPVASASPVGRSRGAAAVSSTSWPASS